MGPKNQIITSRVKSYNCQFIGGPENNPSYLFFSGHLQGGGNPITPAIYFWPFIGAPLIIWWLLCYILPFKGFKPFVTVGLVRHPARDAHDTFFMEASVGFVVETGGEMGGTGWKVHNSTYLPKNQRLELHLKTTPMLELLKDWRNIVCAPQKIIHFFSGSTCELSRVLPWDHHGKWTNSGLGLGFRPRPRPGPESGTEDPRGLFEEGERDAWAGNHSEPKLLKS